MLCLLENRFQIMNFENRSSSNFSDNQNILPSNSQDDEMDVESSIADSDHRYSTASISIFSDENPEHSDEEFSDEISSGSSSNHSDRGAIINLLPVADNQRDFEEETIEDEEDENRLDALSDSSESLHDEMDFASSSDDEEATLAAEIAREELEEAALEEKPIDGDVPFQYTLDSDDESETGSEHEEELEEATLEEESIDDERSEVGSEHSEHLEIVTPQYSTVGPSWLVFSDSESEISDDNETKDVIDIEDASIDSNEDKSEHNEEEMSVELDTTMSVPNAIPSSELSAEEKEELKRNHEFLESAPLASNSSESSLTSSEEAEFRVFIQLTREREALVNGQEIAVEVQDMLEEQVVAVDHAPGIGHGENLLEVVIANGGIQPQLRSSEITHNWLYDFTNHF